MFRCSGNAAPTSAGLAYLNAPTVLDKALRLHAQRALERGIQADYAFPLLKAYFRTAADQQYLDGLRSTVPKNFVLKFKNYDLEPRGYSAEMNTGEKVSARWDARGLFVFNGHPLEVDRLSARGTFEAMAMHLKAKQTRSFDLSLLPRAHAQIVELALFAAVCFGVGLGVGALLMKPALDERMNLALKAVALAKDQRAIDKALTLCNEERKSLQYSSSTSADVVKQLEKEHKLSDMLAAIDCDADPRRLTKSNSGQKIDPDALKRACVKARDYINCLENFKTQDIHEGATPGGTSTGR